MLTKLAKAIWQSTVCSNPDWAAFKDHVHVTVHATSYNLATYYRTPTVNLPHKDIVHSLQHSLQLCEISLCFPLSQGPWTLRIDWFDFLVFLRDSQESSPAPQFESISSMVLFMVQLSTSVASSQVAQW